jgi:hypothetical protein
LSQVVVLKAVNLQQGSGESRSAPVDFLDLRGETMSFEYLAAYRYSFLALQAQTETWME